MTTILLLRHGWTDWSVTPPEHAPLTLAGRQRIRTAAQRIADYRPTLVISSHLARADESAQIVAEELGVPRETDPDLREWFPGPSADRSTFNAALAQMSAEGGEWPSGTTRPWEPLSQVRLRVARVVQEAARRATSGAVVLVSHGVTIHATTGSDLPPGGLAVRSATEFGAETPVRHLIPLRGTAHQAELAAGRDRATPSLLVMASEARGRVDSGEVDRTLVRMAARHEILRCEFSGDGVTLADHAELAAEVVEEVSSSTDLVRRQLTTPLRGDEWPLIRVVLGHGPRGDFLSLAAHPLAADPTSLTRLLAELLDGIPDNPDSPRLPRADPTAVTTDRAVSGGAPPDRGYSRAEGAANPLVAVPTSLLDAAEMAALRRFCASTDRSVSVLVRDALRRALQHQGSVARQVSWWDSTVTSAWPTLPESGTGSEHVSPHHAGEQEVRRGSVWSLGRDETGGRVHALGWLSRDPILHLICGTDGLTLWTSPEATRSGVATVVSELKETAGIH